MDNPERLAALDIRDQWYPLCYSNYNPVIGHIFFFIFVGIVLHISAN